MFAGKSISDINFNEIAYVFPYEKKSVGEGYDLIDVTEDVNEYFTTDASNLDGMIALPDDINETLSRIVGAIQGGNLTALAKNSESLINDIIEMRNSDMDDDDKHEYTLENFCKDNYCAYKNICRKWMGGNN